MRSARGAAVVTVLMMLMILSALGTAMTTSGQTELMVARNTVSAAQSHAAAESGLNHAVELAIPNLQQFNANGFANVSAAMSGLLLGPDGLSGTQATDADNGSREVLDIPRPPAVLALGAANDITHEARVFDNDWSESVSDIRTYGHLRWRRKLWASGIVVRKDATSA